MSEEAPARDLVMPEDQLFRDPTAHGYRDISFQLFPRDRDPIAFGQAHHHTECPSARNDRGFVDGIGGG